MSVFELKNSWLVRLIVTISVVVFGLFLIKHGASNLYQYYLNRDKPDTLPLARTLAVGIVQAAAGMLLIISFLLSSPLAFSVFLGG